MLKTFDLLEFLGLEAKWKDIVREKALIAKGEKSLLKRRFSGSNERLEFTFLTKSEPLYFLLNYKFLSN